MRNAFAEISNPGNLSHHLYNWQYHRTVVSVKVETMIFQINKTLKNDTSCHHVHLRVHSQIYDAVPLQHSRKKIYVL